MSLSFDIALKRGAYTLQASGEIGAGITILFGPSGAGKSLLLSAIAGLTKNKRAKVSLNGAILEDSETGFQMPPFQRGLGLMFQTPRLFPHLSVAENLAYAEQRAPIAKRKLSVGDAAQRFDFTALLGRNVGALSGGEKARIALARALISAPDLLMLDEPFAALDSARRRAFLTELKAIHTDYGLPLLVVTHQIEDAAYIADTVIALKQGRVLAQGEAARVFVSRAFQDLLDPRDQGAAVKIGGDRAWVRADHVMLATEEPRGLSARHVWRARIANLTHARPDTISAEVTTEHGALFAHVTPDAVQELKLESNQELWAIVKAHSAK